MRPAYVALLAVVVALAVPASAAARRPVTFDVAKAVAGDRLEATARHLEAFAYGAGDCKRERRVEVACSVVYSVDCEVVPMPGPCRRGGWARSDILAFVDVVVVTSRRDGRLLVVDERGRASVAWPARRLAAWPSDVVWLYDPADEWAP